MVRKFQRASVLLLLLPTPSLAGEPPGRIVEATADQVRDCKPLGQVIGESHICIKSRAERDALKQAEAIGGTHVVWVKTHCVFGSGEKATARVFDCQPQASLDPNYEDYSTRKGSSAAATEPFQGTATVMSSADLDRNSEDLLQKGFVLIGYAGVSGARVTLGAIKTKAAAVGAEIVLVSSKAAGSETEFQSITTYSGGGLGVNVGFGAASGNLGATSAAFTGSSTSVTSRPGESHTDYVPYSKRSFETQVLFWRKRHPDSIGLHLELLPISFRTALGRNTGAYVVAVEDQSPAFMANVLIGDVIIAVNSEEIRTPSEFDRKVEAMAEKPLTLTVIRQGKQMEVTLSR